MIFQPQTFDTSASSQSRSLRTWTSVAKVGSERTSSWSGRKLHPRGTHPSVSSSEYCARFHGPWQVLPWDANFAVGFVWTASVYFVRRALRDKAATVYSATRTSFLSAEGSGPSPWIPRQSLAACLIWPAGQAARSREDGFARWSPFRDGTLQCPGLNAKKERVVRSAWPLPPPISWIWRLKPPITSASMGLASRRPGIIWTLYPLLSSS